jgi:hypothetical protein
VLSRLHSGACTSGFGAQCSGSARTGPLQEDEISDDTSSASTDTLSHWTSSDDEGVTTARADEREIRAASTDAGPVDPYMLDCNSVRATGGAVGAQLLHALTHQSCSADGLDNDNVRHWEAYHPVAGVPPASGMSLPDPPCRKAVSIAARVATATGSKTPPSELNPISEQSAAVQVS